MVNKYILIVITLIITFITNFILKLPFLTGGLITLTIVTLGYIIYVNNLQRKRYGMFEDKLDPEAFIEATYKAYRYAGKDKQLNSLLNFDLALGHASLGEYERAMKFLGEVEAKYLPRGNKLVFTYYTALMIVYYNLGEYDKAREIYETARQDPVKGKLGERLMNILMANKYFYEEDYQRSRELFENYPKDKMSKRLEVEIIFELASIDEKEGKLEDAKVKYERVAREGNKLYAAKLAREKLKFGKLGI